MRRVVVLGVCAAVGLTIAGVAVAWLTANGTSTVSATFSTTTAKGFKSRSCTGPDGQYQLIDAVYDGSSASAEGKLNGDARIRIRSVYNTTEKIGWANGWLRLDGAVTHFDAVNVDGKLTGLLRGRIGGYGNLLATFTGDFSASGLANAQIGTGTFPSVALVTGKICTGPAGKSVRLFVDGTIDSIVPGSSISVAPEDGSTLQTCALGPGSPSVAGLTKSQRVEMTCVTIDGKLTVAHLKKRG